MIFLFIFFIFVLKFLFVAAVCFVCFNTIKDVPFTPHKKKQRVLMEKKTNILNTYQSSGTDTGLALISKVEIKKRCNATAVQFPSLNRHCKKTFQLSPAHIPV